MPQHNDSDLQIALAFVIKRIEEEACRSGEPLDEDERLLLTHLPTTSALPFAVDPEFPAPVPRDFSYERLIKLAKAAHRYDASPSSELAFDWGFAAAVLKLERHPMSWLLQWAEIIEKKPWWDRMLLTIGGLLFAFCAAMVMWYADRGDESLASTKWALVVCGYVLALIVLHFTLRRFEGWQLRKTIESLRRQKTLSMSQQ